MKQLALPKLGVYRVASPVMDLVRGDLVLVLDVSTRHSVLTIKLLTSEGTVVEWCVSHAYFLRYMSEGYWGAVLDR